MTTVRQHSISPERQRHVWPLRATFKLLATMTNQKTPSFTYLALGDSYTIGEGVPGEQNFPYQLAAQLRQHDIQIQGPTIIATTGWTTDELQDAIGQQQITGPFSLVTLLIGVNNQYRERSLDEYETEFTALLHQAVAFAGGHQRRVLVLSIPDWGLTPFAEGRDRPKIAREIDAFNEVNRSITLKQGCLYLDITGISRACGSDPKHLVADGLHYSARHYQLWAAAAVRLLMAERSFV